MNYPLSTLAATLLLANASIVNAAPSDETIFISAKAPISAEEFSGSVSVVTAEEIRASGATSLAEALEGIAGVTIGTSGSNAGANIQIRGMNAEYALILINGKRIVNTERNISSSQATRNNWVAMPNVERIEVIRGAASSLYGSDALSGVINIITKKATDTMLSSVTASASSYSRSGGESSGVNISTRGPINETVSFSFSVDHQDQNSMLDESGLTILSKNRVTNSQLDFSVDVNDYSQLNLGIIYGEETAADIDVSSRTGAVSTASLSQIKRLFSVDYDSKIADFNTKYSLSNGVTDVMQGTNDWRVSDNNLSVDIDGSLAESQYLSAGIGYRVETAYRYDKDFKDTFKSVTGYLQDSIDINDSHSITAGLSLESHNKYGSEVSPKFYWNWNVDSSLSVKAGYSQGRIAPAIREGSSLYIIAAGPTRTYQGNDDLTPEYSKTVELSALYTEGDLSGSIAVFGSKIKDLITTQDIVTSTSTGTHTLALYSNVDEASIHGLEASVGWDINDAAKLTFSYTYLNAKNESGTYEGKTLTNRPEHTANIKFSQYVSGLDANLSVSLKGVSSQYTDSANTSEINGHGILNLGLSKDLSDSLHLIANIYNLTDREILDDGEALYAGREFRLSLTGSF